MKEYTKRDSCMTMEEVIERNTGMSLKAFLTPQPNPYIHNMDRAVEFFKKKVNDAAEEKGKTQLSEIHDSLGNLPGCFFAFDYSPTKNYSLK